MKYEKEANKIINTILTSINPQPKEYLIGKELIENVAKEIEDIVSTECIDCSIEQIEREDHAEPSFDKEDMD